MNIIVSYVDNSKRLRIYAVLKWLWQTLGGTFPLRDHRVYALIYWGWWSFHWTLITINKPVIHLSSRDAPQIKREQIPSNTANMAIKLVIVIKTIIILWKE